MAKERKQCSIEGCGSAVRARGWCLSHYHRWNRTGNPLPLLRERERCKEEGCARFRVGQGWCETHYARYVRSPKRKAELRATKAGRICGWCGNPIPDEKRSRSIFCSRACKDAEVAASGKQREYVLRSYYRREYGLEWEQVEAMRAAGCAICGAKNGSGRHGQLHIDHDHRTGKVRGVLCAACNHGLSRFADDAARLRAAADYLDR